MSHNHESKLSPSSSHACGCESHCYETVTTASKHTDPARDDPHVTYNIPDLDCPMEEMLLRDKLGVLPGVLDLQFDLPKHQLTVYHTLTNTDSLLQAILALGMQVESVSEAKKNRHTAWLKLIVAVILALGAEISEWYSYTTGLPLVLSLLALALSGFSIYRKAWYAVRHGHSNINVLVSVAAIGAFLLKEWPEAAMTIALYMLAQRIEAQSFARTQHTIHSLMVLAPKEANVLQEDGLWHLMPVANITIGSLIRLKPGECVPLDGIVKSGYSTLVSSSVTGESIPTAIAPGDHLLAGTINQEGEIEYEVTATEKDSAFTRITDSVRLWRAKRASSQRWIENFARVYTPIIFVVAFLTAIIPPLFNGLWHEWIYRALSLLVMACPCALVISIPVAVVSGLTAAMHHGILIKGGTFLEQGKHLTCLAFDKTGTLTIAEPIVKDFVPFSPDQDHLCAVALALAKRSNHPFSKAIVADNTINKGHRPSQNMGDFSAVLGRGVKGTMDGTSYYLGSESWIRSLGLLSPSVADTINKLNQEAKSVIVLASDKTVLALFGMADVIRDTSESAIQSLHTLGVKTVMLSGDKALVTEKIASQVGIHHAQNNLLPAEKAHVIDQLIDKEHHYVGMVGDGINDVPAIAAANIGFAIAATGSDAAIEEADVVLMDSDLRKISTFIRLSRATVAILKQNITVTLGFKLLFLLATIFGYSALWMAIAADMGASLLATANGLRLLRKRLH